MITYQLGRGTEKSVSDVCITGTAQNRSQSTGLVIHIKASWTYIWLPQRGTLHFHLPRKFPQNLTQVQEIHPETFPQHSTFPLIVIWHYSTPDPPDPFIHLSPARISHSIPLPCLCLQAALVTLHHHIFRTPLLLIHLVTPRKFPHLDFAALPCILHVIEATPHLPGTLPNFSV